MFHLLTSPNAHMLHFLKVKFSFQCLNNFLSLGSQWRCSLTVFKDTGSISWPGIGTVYARHRLLYPDGSCLAWQRVVKERGSSEICWLLIDVFALNREVHVTRYPQLNPSQSQMCSSRTLSKTWSDKRSNSAKHPFLIRTAGSVSVRLPKIHAKSLL